jgi:hypothetical protein
MTFGTLLNISTDWVGQDSLIPASQIQKHPSYNDLISAFYSHVAKPGTSMTDQPRAGSSPSTWPEFNRS